MRRLRRMCADPCRHQRRRRQPTQAAKRLAILEGRGHNDMWHGAEYWERIREFVEEVLPESEV